MAQLEVERKASEAQKRAGNNLAQISTSTGKSSSDNQNGSYNMASGK
jgi:hypothetical protein